MRSCIVGRRVRLRSRANASEGRTAPDPACDHFRTLGEEELDEVGAVLAGCTGDEGNLASAVAGHGVHLAGLVLGGVAGHLDGGGDGNGHDFVCFALNAERDSLRERDVRVESGVESNY